eukprot:c20502_g1_i1 orf=208-2220(+)
MDLDAVFTMAENVSRPITDPLGFHVTNEQFLSVDFSFMPEAHASVNRTDPLGFSLFDRPVSLGTTNAQLSNVIDSDDDFGDFTSVPADALHATDALPNAAPLVFPVNTTPELDVGGSLDMFGFHTTSSHSQMNPAQEDLFGHLSATIENPADKAGIELAVSPVKPSESNSDDDWGDFVEHSTATIWDNTQAFDWFDTTQQNVRHSVPTESVTSNANDSFGFWTEPSKVGVQHSEQKVTKFTFDDLGAFAGRNVSEGSKTLMPQSRDAEGFAFSDNMMAAQQKTSALQRTLSGHGRKGTSNEVNSAPIPLSLFGENELEDENSKTELADPVTRSFQGHSRSRALSTGSLPSGGKNLSDIIATLYTESQPDSQSRPLSIMTSVDLNEIESSVNKVNSSKDVFVMAIGTDEVSDNNTYGYQGSAGAGSSSLEECMFGLTLDLKHASDLGSSKGNINTCTGAEFKSQEPTTFALLGSTSLADQCTFVKAWASILAVCAAELELALSVWKQAQNADVHLGLLADLQGKRYFAAIGQVYVVALTLATASNFYKPWLRTASKEAESLLADLARCKAVWLQTDLKEGVRLALDGLEGSVPSSVLLWKGIEGFAAAALEAYLQAGNASVHSVCRMSLLPIAPFNDAGLPPVQWSGSNYLLPLANMWVNRVSHEPLSTLL